jgi:hypothetical protein
MERVQGAKRKGNKRKYQRKLKKKKPSHAMPSLKLRLV